MTIQGHSRKLYDALESPDVTGATFLAALTEASTQLRGERHGRAVSLSRDLSGIAEATVDYRRRMQAQGLCVKGLRRMGAAESQMDRLSDRIKGRGRSWSRQGLGAMMRLLCWRNNGLPEEVTRKSAECLSSVGAGPTEVAQAAEKAANITKGRSENRHQYRRLDTAETVPADCHGYSTA